MALAMETDNNNQQTQTTMKTKRPNAGLFWHVHHEILAEYCYNAKQRREYIRTVKSSEESSEMIKTRLRLMKPVVIPKSNKALKPLAKMLAEIEAVRVIGGQASTYMINKTERDKYLLGQFVKPLAALHKRQCKNCPWNGQTIFPDE